MDATAAIDASILDRRTLGDPDLRREVMRMFALQCEGWLASVKGGRGDAMLAHSISGSAAGVGAEALARAARAVEDERAAAVTLAEPLDAARDAALALSA